MPEIGVRELKARASEILRHVRDERARYTITYRGRPVGVLAPIPEARARERGGEDAWEELIRLGEEISREWRSPLTSTDLLSESRR